MAVGCIMVLLGGCEFNGSSDRDILSLMPNDVVSVVLDREYKNLAVDQRINLVQKPVTVSNREDIASICAALRSAKQVSPNHPSGLWYCAVALHTTNWTSEVLISRTDNQGSILWLRHAYRCDALGTALESIAEKHEFGRLTDVEAAERRRTSDRDDAICVTILLSGLAGGFSLAVLCLSIFVIWKVSRRSSTAPSLTSVRATTNSASPLPEDAMASVRKET